MSNFLRQQLERWIAPIKRRISNIIIKSVLDSLDTSGKFSAGKVILQKDETQSDLTYVQPYGWVHDPEEGAETIVLNINGNRNQGLIICIGDSRYKFSVSKGDVAIYSKGDNFVHLKSSGEVHINGSQVDIGDLPSTVKKLVNENFQPMFNGHKHVFTELGVPSTGYTGGPASPTGLGAPDPGVNPLVIPHLLVSIGNNEMTSKSKME